MAIDPNTGKEMEKKPDHPATKPAGGKTKEQEAREQAERDRQHNVPRTPQ